jgi:DNA-binding XRE family transcriptional regulator
LLTCQYFFLIFFDFFDNLFLNMPRKPDLPPLDIINGETIGHRLARLRKKKKMTQQKLAEKIGIQRYQIANYEQGRTRIYDEMLIRLALELDCTVDYLVGFKQKDKLESLHKK